MHADGHAGLNDLYRSGDIREGPEPVAKRPIGPGDRSEATGRMAHVRRKSVDIHRARNRHRCAIGSSDNDDAIADEAVLRIAQLYAVEKEARGSPPDFRVESRQGKATPIFDDLEARLHARLPGISGKSPLAVAIRYALTRMKRLRPYLDPGIPKMDDDTAERAMRSVAPFRQIAAQSPAGQ